MKKLFLIFIAIALVSAYMYYISLGTPAVSGGKNLREGQAESQVDSMPVIKVMTYNIHRGMNKDDKLDLEGIAEVIKNSGADIVALQEVERFSVRTGFKDQIKYIADKLSMKFVFGKSIKILNGQYGNGILSKYPIEEYEVTELPSEGEQRTLLKAVLNVNGNKIHIYNTHLGLKQSERKLQIDEIMKISRNEENYLVAGDFNTTGDKLDAITSRLIDCGSLGDHVPKITFEKDGLSGRIDFIFVSKSFEVKDYKVIESDASDHYPAISTLKFTD